MSVGIGNKVRVDYMIQKFPERNFSLVLFHYDDSSLSEWKEYSWSKRAVHIQAHGQGKWWFAKRFLHPDITAAYEHVFLWDEDLGLDNFNVLRFVEVMAPVFTRKAWACVWHLIQYFYACAGGPAHENMGIIDTDYIEHQAQYAPDSNQVFRDTEKTLRTLVEERSAAEDDLLRNRWYAGLAFDWDGPCTSRHDSP